MSNAAASALQSLQRLYNLSAGRALDLQERIRIDRRLADQLEDYAHNCPAEIDGGPGLEGQLLSGAAALRTLQLQKARADSLRSEMCRLASWSQTPQVVADALCAAVEADNARLDAIEEGSK